MTRRGSNRSGRRRKQDEPFLAKGVQVLGLTAALWLGSLLMGGSGVLSVAAGGLRSILWLPALIGLGLLGIHLLLKKGTTPSLNDVDSPATKPARKSFAEMRDAMVNGPDRRTSTTKPSPDALRDTRLGRHPDKSPVNSTATSAPVEPARTVAAETVPYKQSRWSSEVFASIEWRRFEAVVEALFAQAGFETRSESHGADGGVDIWLHSKNAEGPVSVVQCKHWQGKPVTVKEMREFLGVMVSKGVKRGTYATTSRYTADALEFAKAHGINAQDGNGLLKLIAQRTPEQQNQLLDVAYEGEYWKPTCASCGVKMTERTSGKDGNRFWGCVNYPRCKRTLAMKAA